MNKTSLSDRDIERLVSGRGLPDSGEEALAAFFGSARRVLTLPPGKAAESAHLAAIVAAAGESSVPVKAPNPQLNRRTAQRSLGLRLRTAAVKVGVAALGLTTTSAGLAMAGVNLPGTFAEKAFKVVGIELPNQDGDGAGAADGGETSRRVHEAQEKARNESASGCEFGAAVSRAARGVTDEDRARCDSAGHDKAKDKGPGSSKDKPHPRGKITPGHGGTPPGGGGENPGRRDDNPGQGEENSGRRDDNPGQGEENRNHDNSGPGSGDDSDDDNSGPGGGNDSDDDND